MFKHSLFMLRKSFLDKSWIYSFDKAILHAGSSFISYMTEFRYSLPYYLFLQAGNVRSSIHASVKREYERVRIESQMQIEKSQSEKDLAIIEAEREAEVLQIKNGQAGDPGK